MENGNNIKVEVAYARPEQQVIVAISLAVGSTVEQAIVASGLLQRFPEIDLKVNKVGVFGRLAKLQTALRPGDRVEIYRGLIADPKEIRRQRAAEGKATKRGASDRNREGEES